MRRGLARFALLAVTLGGVVTGVLARTADTRSADPHGQILDRSGGAAAFGRQAGSGMILGRVVDGSTDQPIAGASVTPYEASGAEAVGFPNTQVVTGSDGLFVFRRLGRGDWTIRASAAGYLPSGGPGMTRPGGPFHPVSLGDGENRNDVVVRMWRTGVISGEVYDEQGEPIEGITVTVLKIDNAGGRRRFTNQQTAVTDDRGSYRFSSLTPGNYAVCALFSRHILPISARSGGSGYRIADLMLISGSGQRNVDPAPDESGRLSVFQDVCHPGAPNLQAALPITVESGLERSSVSLPLRLVPAATVRGTVTGPGGGAGGITVHLVPVDAGESDIQGAEDAAYTTTDATGMFGLAGVPAGSYVLHAVQIPSRVVFMSSVDAASQSGGRVVSDTSRPMLWASQPVEVGERSVGGIVLTLREGFRFSGRVAFEGTARERPPVARMSIAFDPVGRQPSDFNPPRAQVEADGRFSTTGLLPGKYYARLSADLNGWTLKSILVGNSDASDEPFEAASGDVSGVVVTLTDRPVELSGVVRSENGSVASTSVVSIFPFDRARTLQSGGGRRREQTIGVSTNGSYKFSGLPPGDYGVVAVDGRVGLDMQDPKTIEALARAATRVTLRESESRTQDLTAAPIR